jgi:hypothetical protein
MAIMELTDNKDVGDALDKTPELYLELDIAEPN